MQPLDLGATLDRAFKIYTGHFVDLFVASLVVTLSTAVLSFIAVAAFSGAPFLAVVLLLFIVVLSALFSIGAGYGIASAAFEGRTVTWQQSLSSAVEKLGPLLVTGFLAALAVIVGVILLILPGIWIGVAMFAAVPVVMVEGLSGTAALSRSIDLVKGHWWATFGRLVVGGILVGIVTSIINAATGGNDPSVIGLIVRAFATAAVSPFTVALVVVVYFDLRARKEGAAPAAPGGGPMPPAPVAPTAPAAPTSVAPPGSGWSAPDAAAPVAPPIPPVAPPMPPPVPPSAPEPPVGGTAATSGSLWSAGDPLASPEPPATAPAPEQQWQPPSPAPTDEPGLSTPPPADEPPQNV